MLVQRKLTTLLPFGCCLLLAIACGGKDDDNGNTGGTGGSSSQGGTGGTSKGGTGSSTGGTGSSTGGTGSSTGGTGSSTGGQFTSDLPGNKPLGSLSDAEAEQLCDELRDYYESSDFETQALEVSCRASGVIAALTKGVQTDAAAQSTCQAVYDSCKASPPDTTSEECEKPDASCTATVNEYQACLAGALDYLGDVKDLFPPCSELTLDDFENIGMSGATTPAACETFEEKCADGPALPGETD